MIRELGWVFVVISISSVLSAKFPEIESSSGKIHITCYDSPNLDNTGHTDLFERGNYTQSGSNVTADISTFRDATKVEFNSCILPRIPQKFIRELRFIESINLTNSGIQSIKKEDLRYNTNLKTLILAGNSLTMLPEYLFTFTPRIKEIDLSHNKISSIDPKAFANAAGAVPLSKSLISLNLSHNKFKQFNFTLFSPSFNELQLLNVSNNQIKGLIGWNMACFPNLKVLDLANNDNCLHSSIYLRTIDSLRFIKTFNISMSDLMSNPSTIMQSFNAVGYEIHCERSKRNPTEEREPLLASSFNTIVCIVGLVLLAAAIDISWNKAHRRFYRWGYGAAYEQKTNGRSERIGSQISFVM